MKARANTTLGLVTSLMMELDMWEGALTVIAETL
jgi:hypothetical protein